MSPQYVTQAGEVVAVRKVKQLEPTGPRPPVPGLAKFVVQYASTGLKQVFTAANILHIFNTGFTGITNTSLASVLSGLASKFATRFNPQRSSSWKITNYQLVTLDGTGNAAAQPANAAGTAASACLQPNCAVVLSWQAPAYWRGGKFRTYLPGVPGGSVLTSGDGQLDTTYTSPLQAAANGFITDVSAVVIGAQSCEQVGVSYFHNFAFRPTPLVLPITGVVVHDRVDSQRRRLGKEVKFPLD